MKSHAKSKRRTTHPRHAAAHAPRRTHKTTTPRRGHASTTTPEAGRTEASAAETFTAMETGRPDRDEGRGPLGQEGEGEAQNDQLASLEGTEPREDGVEGP